jgi:transposase
LLTDNKVNPIVKRFYEDHKGRLRGKKLIVARARKLAAITWAVLYYNKPFDASE